jgi:FHS family L-fucose permease-like MFS transporter
MEIKILTKNGTNYLIPFILITTCFALWGFANDMNGPIVDAFSKIFAMGTTGGTLVQSAINLAYFCMAFPATKFIQRYSFKAGVLMGLGLFTTATFLFLPAKMCGYFIPFLAVYFILGSGLSFLEISCNPYIYCMGSEETATRRLNLAQSFNPIGALTGMYVALDFIQDKMSGMTSAQRKELTEAQFNMLKDNDLNVLIGPYLCLGMVCLLLLVLIRLYKMPKASDTSINKPMKQALRELLHIKNYREGVVAQFFYVGAQVACWTLILRLGTQIFTTEGMEVKEAGKLAMWFNIGAMILFTISRFVCTWFLKYIAPGRLLSILAITAAGLMVGVILFPDRDSIYCLVGVSACMSLMFPTIYGIALRSVGDNVKYASTGLIMAILGGSILPPLQAMIIDSGVSVFYISAANLSFVIPLICFIVIAIYGYRSYIRHYIMNPNSEDHA